MTQNVLLVVIDAMRADKIYDDGTYKSSKTPFLDSIITKSTSFSKAFSVTSTTTPSFTSILTGLYPPNHGVRSLYGYKLRNNIPTLPELLKNKGYHTYAEVTGPLVKEIGLNRGFDAYSYREKNNTYYSSWGSDFLNNIKKGYYKEPWFILLHLWELHSPRFVPSIYDSYKYGWNKYERALSGLDEYLSKLHSVINNDDVFILTGDHGEKIAHNIIHKYYLSLERKVLKYMKKGDGNILLKNMGHGYNVYDYLTRIPLIIKANNILKRNIHSNSLCSQIDILPTIYDILGYNPKKLDLDGCSLVNSTLNDNRKYIFCEACGSVIPDKKMWKVGIRTDRYKYIYNPYSQNPFEELYDLAADRKERNNIASKNPELSESFRYLINEKYLKK
jgi:arylsulfatase A-like enzyme